MLSLKIGICDDDIVYCNDIASKLDHYMISYDIDISYKTYTSGKELLEHYDKMPDSYDILFLDVEMPEMDGLTVAKKIKAIDRNIYIIFVSNYPEYMQDSFRVHPFYYLIKPLSANTFSKTMHDIVSTIESEHRLITLIHTDTTEETINIKDIRYIDVHDGKKGILCFHFFTHKTLAKGKLAEWELKLADFGFFLCHRGILINIAHIHYFESNTAIMDNGENVPLSRGNEKKLKDLYSNNIVKLKNL